jgi:hypothetical protein
VYNALVGVNAILIDIYVPSGLGLKKKFRWFYFYLVKKKNLRNEVYWIWSTGWKCSKWNIQPSKYIIR